MPEPSSAQVPPHEFPFWPFGCLAFYSRAMRDFGRCSQSVSQATDALEAMRAEGDCGVKLWRHMMQAYYDLAVLPITLAAKAAAAADVEPAEAPRQAAE